jgi:hypothetical protein
VLVSLPSALQLVNSTCCVQLCSRLPATVQASLFSSGVSSCGFPWRFPIGPRVFTYLCQDRRAAVHRHAGLAFDHLTAILRIHVSRNSQESRTHRRGNLRRCPARHSSRGVAPVHFSKCLKLHKIVEGVCRARRSCPGFYAPP